MATLVYQYGTHSRVKLPEEAVEQLRLAHEMRNALVEAELDLEAELKGIWSDYPAVAEIEVEIEQVDTTIARLLEQIREERAEDRSTVTRPETAQLLRDAQKQLKELRKARKAGIGEAYVIVKPQIEELRQKDKNKKKEIRQSFAAQGLYWGTYNSILDDHRVAANRVKAERREGRPAQMRKKQWRGEGTLTIQLQHEDGDPVRSPELLASGEGKWRNAFRITAFGDPVEWAKLTDAERKNSGLDRGTVFWTLGKKFQFELPFTIHRPLPLDADVCGAQLTVRRYGPLKELTLAVTIKIPDPTPVEGGFPTAAHFGWRLRDDGSVRVAVWVSAKPLDVPEHVRDIVRSYDDGRWGEIIMPKRWIERAEIPPTLRSTRDRAMEPVLEKLATWLDEHPQEGGPSGADVRRWKSAGRLGALAKAWQATPPIGADVEKIVHHLKAWCEQDEHLWIWEAGARLRSIRCRDDAWRRAAAWLGDRSGKIVLDALRMAELRRRPKDPETDSTLSETEARAARAKARVARARATMVAPGTLRESMVKAAVRRGVAVVDAPQGLVLTRHHRECGHVADPDPRYAASIVVTCPGCGKTYDQDHNAAMLILNCA